MYSIQGLISLFYCVCVLKLSKLSSNAWSVCVSHSVVPDSLPDSMSFSRQEYWSGLPCPPPGDRPNPGIEPESLKSPALAGGFFTTSAAWEAQCLCNRYTQRHCFALEQQPQKQWSVGQGTLYQLQTSAFKGHHNRWSARAEIGLLVTEASCANLH